MNFVNGTFLSLRDNVCVCATHLHRYTLVVNDHILQGSLEQHTQLQISTTDFPLVF